MPSKLESKLGRAVGAIQEARASHNQVEIRKRVATYHTLAGKFLPVVMWKAKIYCDRKDEKLPNL